MADYITGIQTDEGVKKYDYRSLANLPASVTDSTNTVISPNADYAEVGEWADGNTGKENRLGYFIAVAEVGDNTIKIRKATSHDDVRGVSVYNPAFSGNASEDKYGQDGELLPQYNYVGIMGIIPVIDNGRCSVNGRCMPADDGTAVPSSNNMGYAVLERVDATRVLIAVEPAADMVQRIKTDMEALEALIGGGGGSGGSGTDGITPHIGANGNWWIGDTDTGVKAAGTNGSNGADGVSPTVAVTSITGGHRITITDKNGTKTVDVMDGTDGSNGKDGAAGKDGKGIKTVARTSGNGAAGTTDTYTITYTDNTTSTFTVYNGKDGSGEDGADGQRGTGILKVSTSPTSYTTATNGINPIKRMSISTIKSEAGVGEVLVGDCICHSYYLYHIYYLDSTYAYMDKSQSIRGATGSAGTAGAAGADGYTPVKGTDYWTEADKAEIKAYVDDAILGGAW